MRVAVLANVRTTQAATESEAKALRVAFNGGAVTGLLVVGLALLSVGIFFNIMRGHSTEHAVDSLVGLALGSSLISVFARLGGGIYTKAADVGADLVGKVESNLNEDDPRNPATIADNVGDNVGDCAGMAADVFETYAVSLIGALLIGFLQLGSSPAAEGAIVYPFVIGGISVRGAVLGILYVNIRSNSAKADRTLMEGVLVSGLISAALYWPATMGLLPDVLEIAGRQFTVTGGRRIVPVKQASRSGLADENTGGRAADCLRDCRIQLFTVHAGWCVGRAGRKSNRDRKTEGAQKHDLHAHEHCPPQRAVNSPRDYSRCASRPD